MSILRRDFLFAAGVAVMAFALYYATAARDIVVGDTPELITACALRGIAHPPGYPLFTILGHLLSEMPLLGTIPFRVNLLSVLCDSLTVAVVFFTALRLTKARLASALAALTLAITPLFWSWSLAAEVFPLNNLIAASLICCLISWHERPERSAWLIAAAFFAGLGLTNHQTIVLLGPAVCFVLWRRRETLLARPRVIGFCVIAFALGLLPYLYIPIAAAYHPAYSWGDISSWRDFITLVLRKNYGSGRLVSATDYLGGSAISRIIALGASFGPLAGTLSIFGVIEAFRRMRWYIWFVLIAFVFAGPFFVSITNLNLATAPSALFVLQRFFLLSHVILAPLLAFGILLLGEVVPSLGIGRQRIAAALVSIAIVVTAFVTYRHVDLSRNQIARIFATDVYQTVEPGTVLLGTGDGLVFPLLYGQLVDGFDPEVTLVIVPLLKTDWYVRQLRRRHPDLNIPFDRYDAQTNNLKALMEANRSRSFATAGTIGNEDHSLEGEYWPYQRGIVTVIEPKSTARTMEEMVRENERWLPLYRPPNPRLVRHETFEEDILNVYAWPPYRVGSDYERLGSKTQARRWYERALAINPNFKMAREALARVAR
jgi:4-amino-4-deoxy-L-arabinose transferase-like glycosyltransferase